MSTTSRNAAAQSAGGDARASASSFQRMVDPYRAAKARSAKAAKAASKTASPKPAKVAKTAKKKG